MRDTIYTVFRVKILKLERFAQQCGGKYEQKSRNVETVIGTVL